MLRSKTDAVMGLGTLTWERRDPESDVLVVTNMWPDEDRPVYGIHVQREVESLLRAGIRCDVLYIRGYQSPLVYVWSALWLAASTVALRRRYGLIHAHAGETAAVMRFHLGTPVLATYHGDDLLGNPGEGGGLTRQSRFRAFVIRQHSRLMSATITVSSEMEAVLPAQVQAANRVVPLGINTSLFRPLPREDARRELGWHSGELVALFGATKPWIPRKRHWLAAAACKYAESRLDAPVRLVVAEGIPPERMPLLMNAANCLLLTSSIEGSPCIVKEALMCNLPVVATPAGDVESLLCGVESSHVCPPREEDLGQALVACLSDLKRSNGRVMAGWLADDAITERIIRLYEDLAPVKRRRSCEATEGFTLSESSPVRP